MGDAKGAALVLMVEILAASLGGANFGYEASSFFTAEGKPPGVGQLIMAFDPMFFSGGSFTSRLEDLIDEILQQNNTRIPGSGRSALRDKAVYEGLKIPENLMNELNQLN